ncbi:alpha/beta hydrolase [Kitasatospora sp. NPDC092948]|uniref:alpha/beta hydrolase n=1 Tax=Kitasatospora sp. NPDC092948 TaxID=3364088 RepID=UPI00382365F2
MGSQGFRPVSPRAAPPPCRPPSPTCCARCSPPPDPPPPAPRPRSRAATRPPRATRTRTGTTFERTRAAHPLFAPLTESITPCAFWDSPREARVQARRDTPALIVASTGDPRVPYTRSAALHRSLPSSRLLTLAGTNQHVNYGAHHNSCPTPAGGRLPSRDRACAA